MTRALLQAVATAALATAAPAATPMSTPPNPFIDKGACPFECCTYRDWTTLKPVALLDKPDGKTTGVSIPAKTVVHGVTGQVWSIPLAVPATHAFEDSPIKKGDTFYTLHSAGEGFWVVWFKGKTYSIDMTEPADNAYLEKASKGAKWWVQVKTRDGKTGWVLDASQFDNQDACG
jgi:hypothetical protein